MFENICKCGAEETQSQIDYLSSTSVSRTAELVRSGDLILEKGIICSLRILGNLKTEFGQIGPLVPLAKSGEKKFLVSEIVPTLRANRNIPDNGLLNSIESIAELEVQDKIDFNITVLLLDGDAIIKDGNKRTIAFFENRRNLNLERIHYYVYLLRPR